VAYNLSVRYKIIHRIQKTNVKYQHCVCIDHIFTEPAHDDEL